MRHFLKILLPLLATIGFSRLMSFTDFWMVSFLGEAQTAAFAVAPNISFIDAVVAFSLVPLILKELSAKEQVMLGGRIQAERLLFFVFCLSLLTLLACIIIYPVLFIYSGLPQDIYGIAFKDLSVRVVAIPVKMLQLSTSMMCHALMLGRRNMKINAGLLIANIPLDFLAIFVLKLGLYGSTIVTELLTLIHLLINIRLIRTKLPHLSFSLFRPVQGVPWKNWFPFCGAEAFRVSSERIFFFCITWIIIRLTSADTPLLQVYSSFGAISALLIIPSIALNRATTIAKQQDKNFNWRRTSLVSGAMILPIVLIAAVFAQYFPAWLIPSFSLDNQEYFRPMFWGLILFTPLLMAGSILQGALVASGKIAEIAKVDLYSRWGVGMVFMLSSLFWGYYWLFWFSYALIEVAKLLGFLYVLGHRYRFL